MIEERLPTLEAQMTAYAGQITQNAPTVNAIMTLVATSGAPIGTPGAEIPPTAGTPAPTVGGGSTGGGGPAAFDGGDGYPTTLVQAIAVGQTVNGTLATATEGQNWLLDASAGQTITISVTGSGATDARLKLIDPAGMVIAQDDDSGGAFNPRITATLPAAGQYTIRIDTWTPGAYSLSVQ